MNMADHMRAAREDMILNVLMGYSAGTMTGPNGLPERDITAEATLVEEAPYALEQPVSSENRSRCEETQAVGENRQLCAQAHGQ